MIYSYKGKIYPSYLKNGNAIKYILPIAKYFLKGNILDIGGTKEWHYPKSKYVNISSKNDYHAMNIPNKMYDGIISSHTLEHLKDPYWALKYWTEHLKKNGVLFLYLPHVNQYYWAFDCPKHMHIFVPEIIQGWLQKLGYKDIVKSSQDMYFSFTVVAWKK